ncbi:MAG: multi-sensor signal transduction histidine kinase [Candidatus Angelobacter sp.]|nr:multi-sensor signal transduction histidine kinase [Candidatus Angelobacter sp.]
MRSRVFFKLLVAFVLVIATATLIMDIAIRREWESSLRKQITQSLTEKTRMFANRVDANKDLPLAQIVAEQAQAGGVRATVIDAKGTVLADSEASAPQMENHAARPEFIAALAGRLGVASRTSKTVGTELLYVALPVRGGAVRLAYPLSSIEQTTAVIQSKLLWASGLALLVATLIAVAISHSISMRLKKIVEFAEHVAAGDLSARIAESASDEIAQVASSLDLTARNLERSFAALQLNKDQLETLLNSIPNGVLAVTADRILAWANGAMKSLEPQIRVGAPLVESFRDPDLLHALEMVVERSETQSVQAAKLIPGKTFNVTAAPMPGGGAVAVFQDVTEIERVEKTRRDFIANVSHELRTPLTSIQGYVETVLDSYPDSGQGRQFLEIIQRNSARMARLTEDLLVLARVESGEEKPKQTPVAVAELLNEAKENFDGIAQTRGISLSVGPSVECRVNADKDAIQQVFANLIENALKYSPTGGKVVLGANASGDAVQFYVRDCGPGISLEHQQRLFERFYRVDASRSRDSGGTGLGLAIVKHIVLNHGGTVWVESALNHGASFSFTLPLSKN